MPGTSENSCQPTWLQNKEHFFFQHLLLMLEPHPVVLTEHVLSHIVLLPQRWCLPDNKTSSKIMPGFTFFWIPVGLFLREGEGLHAELRFPQCGESLGCNASVPCSPVPLAPVGMLPADEGPYPIWSVMGEGTASPVTEHGFRLSWSILEFKGRQGKKKNKQKPDIQMEKQEQRTLVCLLFSPAPGICLQGQNAPASINP